MRKELGKWLMDIAKYIITAVVLSSVFGAIDSDTMYLTGVISVVVTLIIGLYLISDKPLPRRSRRHNESEGDDEGDESDIEINDD